MAGVHRPREERRGEPERVGGVLPFALRLVDATDEAIVYRMLPGSPWPFDQQPGTRWASWVGRAIGTVGSVRAADLPDTPPDWPAEGDRSAYANHFLDRMDEVVRFRRPLFGDVFDTFGHPTDPVAIMRERWAATSDSAKRRPPV